MKSLLSTPLGLRWPHIAAVVAVPFVMWCLLIWLPEQIIDEVPAFNELVEQQAEIDTRYTSKETFERLFSLEAERSDNVAEFRKLAAQLLAGSLVAVSLFYTSRRANALENQVAVTEKGQLTDRFSNAVDQLGNENAVDVRFGGLYALEAVAKEAAANPSNGLEGAVPLRVIAAFVRRDRDLSEYYGVFPPDVQIACDILGRSRGYLLHERHDLTGANLLGADLTGASLYGANLYEANLYDANLTGADLAEANFTRWFGDSGTLWPEGFTPSPPSSQTVKDRY